MASESDPVRIPAASLVHGSQAQTTVPASGKSLPASGQTAPTAASARATQASRSPDLAAQVALLNKFLNDSGRPDEFRVAPQSGPALIQEINPASGEVIAEYPAIAFPALARSLGLSRAAIDEHA
jgi:uncharacterized FlaG/YvyC family protein